MVGPEAHGDLQRFECALVVACPPQRCTEVVLRVEEIGIAFAGALELCDRVGRSSLKTVDEPEPVVRDGQPGFDVDRVCVSPDSGVELTPRFMLGAENVVPARFSRRRILLGGNATGERHRGSDPHDAAEHTSFWRTTRFAFAARSQLSLERNQFYERLTISRSRAR